jgi:DNA-binding GntR family transcriptional regulator
MDMPSFGRPLWGDVMDALRERIVSGAMRPGQRLVEQEIATEFGISRGPVRSAITGLHALGLVTVSPRRGAEVAIFSAQDVIEIYELREALEVIALDHAHHISATVIERLRAEIDRSLRAWQIQDHRASVDADLEFHRELCHLSPNSRLIGAWETQAEQFRTVMSAALRSDPKLVEPVVNKHEAIFEALVRGDVELAKEALTRHLRSARDLLVGPDKSERDGTPFVDGSLSGAGR